MAQRFSISSNRTPAEIYFLRMLVFYFFASGRQVHACQRIAIDVARSKNIRTYDIEQTNPRTTIDDDDDDARLGDQVVRGAQRGER
jgi:hypothetical protein